jgi:tricorn protease
MRRKLILLASALLASTTCALPAARAAADPLLLQQPTLSATQIAFVYGGEIWVVPRSGGRAVRLVSGQGALSGPVFSPMAARLPSPVAMTATPMSMSSRPGAGNRAG